MQCIFFFFLLRTHNFDRYTIVALICHFTISEVIELVRIRNNMDDLTEGLFLALIYITLCLKHLNFLVRQCELRSLLDCFRAKLCQSRNFAEISILKRYDRKGKFSNFGILNWYIYLKISKSFWNEKYYSLKLFVKKKIIYTFIKTYK